MIKSGTELRYNYSDTKNLHWRAKVCFSLYLFNRFCWKVILMSHDLVELPHYSYCCYIFRYGWRNFRKKPFAPSQLTMWRMHSMARLGLAVYGVAKHWYRYNSSLLVTETFLADLESLSVQNNMKILDWKKVINFTLFCFYFSMIFLWNCGCEFCYLYF